MKPVLIIPALNPDEKLLELAESLKDYEMPAVAVDDGSRPECQNIFASLESRYQWMVCGHPANLGKGAALKTGIEYAQRNYPQASGFITADADGQHAADDIARVARSLGNNPGAIIMGIRDFCAPGIPFKSRWGNRITSAVFWLSTGQRCTDTQTGLRGIPASLAETCLAVPGSRYEYEMNLLLEMERQGIPLAGVPVATIYLDDNRSSHFHPLRDSFIIYFNILKYSLSSLLSAATDLSLFTVLASMVFGSGAAGLLAATVIARLISGVVNFSCNKYWVFESQKRPVGEAGKYLALFCGQMLASWLLVSALSGLPLNLALIKAIVDSSLFFISYMVQKRYIFQTRPKGAQSADAEFLVKTA